MREPINAEERDILGKFERGDLPKTANAAEEMQKAREAALDSFNKTPRVNPRLP